MVHTFTYIIGVVHTESYNSTRLYTAELYAHNFCWVGQSYTCRHRFPVSRAARVCNIDADTGVREGLNMLQLFSAASARQFLSWFYYRLGLGLGYANPLPLSISKM